MPDVKDMELRDWFAGQALAALIIQSAGSSQPGETYQKGRGARFAERAYEFADAMLEERKKRGSTAGGASP
jgi:hypothetical protein